jgi:hypothetical protein
MSESGEAPQDADSGAMMLNEWRERAIVSLWHSAGLIDDAAARAFVLAAIGHLLDGAPA